MDRDKQNVLIDHLRMVLLVYRDYWDMFPRGPPWVEVTCAYVQVTRSEERRVGKECPV